MNLYLKPKAATAGGSLSSILLDAAAKKQVVAGHVSPASSFSSSSSWDERLREETGLSSADVFAANRSESHKKMEKGWRLKGGVRTYGTWRNGKWVEGIGAEGMKLAIGDGYVKVKETNDMDSSKKRKGVPTGDKENNQSMKKGHFFIKN
jgi:hypothetical protein